MEPPTAIAPTAPLTELPPRTTARIAAIAVDGDDAVRLKALGLCVGRRVELIQAGDPLIVRVLGVRVGLSSRLAAVVYTEAS
jgi:Fe2+ transport system protein FeoA